MRAIVNVNKNWAIGKEGGLFVNIPEDMKFFRTATKGKIVLMGRKTLESFPGKKPLKGRVNLVLTRDVSRISDESIQAADVYYGAVNASAPENILTEILSAADKNIHAASPEERKTVLAVIPSLDDALKFEQNMVSAGISADELFCIGGASVYKMCLPYCSECLVTENDAEGDADAYFPNLKEDPEWELKEEGELKEFEGIHFRFNTYSRK